METLILMLAALMTSFGAKPAVNDRPVVKTTESFEAQVTREMPKARSYFGSRSKRAWVVYYDKANRMGVYGGFQTEAEREAAIRVLHGK